MSLFRIRFSNSPGFFGLLRLSLLALGTVLSESALAKPNPKPKVYAFYPSIVCPIAILAPNVLLKTFPNYQLKMQGLRSGEPNENFVLLAIDSTLNLTRASKSGIGAVGILDRKGRTEFVASLMPGTPGSIG